MKQHFYICKHCNNIVTKIRDCGVPVSCCGEPMHEIIPGTTDAAQEKHVPVWQAEGGLVTVNVGSIEHPMTPEHYIEFIVVQTSQGSQCKKLNPGDSPKARFALCDNDQVEQVYAFCNLHSLWKA